MASLQDVHTVRLRQPRSRWAWTRQKTNRWSRWPRTFNGFSLERWACLQSVVLTEPRFGVGNCRRKENDEVLRIEYTNERESASKSLCAHPMPKSRSRTIDQNS